MVFYRPKHDRTGEMWDTWLYWRDGVHYLYYLAKAGDHFDNISMATSPDGLRWTEVGPILQKSEGTTWMGTGSTWRAPGKRSKFQMNFSEWKGPRQTIFFAESEDLVHWQRLGADCEFVQDERWYQRLGRWDCIWTLPQPDGGLYGYWTASPHPETGARFGFGRSADGIHWEALPPPTVHGVFDGEVGAVEKIGDRYFMMYGTYNVLERINMMITLMADKVDGPFRITPKNPHLLGGHTYFTRFYRCSDTLLVNHHCMARDGHMYMGLLKQALVDGEGTLRLGWWKGNDRLAGQRTPLEMSSDDAPEGAVAMVPARLDVSRGLLLECRLLLPPTPFAPRRGLYVESMDSFGTGLLFDAQGRAEFCRTNPAGTICKVEKCVDREAIFGKPALLRLVMEHSLMEVYLDDILIDVFSPSAPFSGRIGVIRGGNQQAISELVVANCTGDARP
jgi:hypothetical protein